MNKFQGLQKGQKLFLLTTFKNVYGDRDYTHEDVFFEKEEGNYFLLEHSNDCFALEDGCCGKNKRVFLSEEDCRKFYNMKKEKQQLLIDLTNDIERGLILEKCSLEDLKIIREVLKKYFYKPLN